MIDQKLLNIIVEKYGSVGILVLWLFYIVMKHGWVLWKKMNHEFVSYEDLGKKIKSLEEQMAVHVKVAADLEILKQTQDLKNLHIEEKVDYIQTTLNEVKNLLIQKWHV